MSLEQNLRLIDEQILSACKRSLRPRRDIRIVAVSKAQPADSVRELFALGVKTFGENYVQEAMTKVKELSDLQCEWHFVGNLQTNKMRDVVGRFKLLHSIGRVELLEAIQKEAEKKDVIQDVLLQLNLAQEESKSGFSEEDIFDVIRDWAKASHIRICGLMTFPPQMDPEAVRPYFTKLKKLFDAIKESTVLGADFKELSMGSSHDFQVAIDEGATLLRLGTALFGERESK